MGLLNRLFNGRKHKAAGPPSLPPTSMFQESEPGERQPSKNAPRRELVQVVVRDTMRKHGIPSDWIGLRLLSTTDRRQSVGVHVQLVVQQGHEDLLGYVYAFQDALLREIERFDPRASDWLMGIAWQFQGRATEGKALPEPGAWAAGAAAAPAVPEPEPHDDVEADLKALFAIRDAAMAARDGEEPRDFQPTRPGFEDSERK